jgi:hypothetical protein
MPKQFDKLLRVILYAADGGERKGSFLNIYL